MKSIIVSLEALASAIDKGADPAKTGEAIKTTRDLTKNYKDALIRELDTELSIWQSKLSVILKEPVGKQGMAKHARFWAERLKAINTSF